MIKCPKCGKLNNKSAKFCTYCGAPLKSTVNINNATQNRSNIQSQPKFNNNKNSQQWTQANQNFNNISNYSSNYIEWLRTTLRHPLSTNTSHANPYFGIISFLLSSIFTWIALFLGQNNTATKYITRLINGHKSVLNFSSESINSSSLTLLLASFINIFLVVATAFIGTKMVSNSNLDIFSFSNHFASMTNILVPCSILLIFCSIIPVHTGFIAYLTCACMLITYIVGISTSIITAKGKTNTVNKIYIAIFATLIYTILLPLFNSIIGRIFL